MRINYHLLMIFEYNQIQQQQTNNSPPSPQNDRPKLDLLIKASSYLSIGLYYMSPYTFSSPYPWTGLSLVDSILYQIWQNKQYCYIMLCLLMTSHQIYCLLCFLYLLIELSVSFVFLKSWWNTNAFCHNDQYVMAEQTMMKLTFYKLLPWGYWTIITPLCLTSLHT